MKKVLFLSILCLFVCTSLAFATAEQTGGMELQGTVATVKDGILPATILLTLDNNGYENARGMFFTGVMTINVINGEKNIYDRTFPCTAYYNPTDFSFSVTSTGTAFLYGTFQEDQYSLVLQIPGDGMTGKFSN